MAQARRLFIFTFVEINCIMVLKEGEMVKSTGIVRKVDQLGRIGIPKELQRTQDINVKDPLEIFVEDDQIILQKYRANTASYLSGDISEENLSLANGKLVVTKEEADQLVEEIQSYMNK